MAVRVTSSAVVVVAVVIRLLARTSRPMWRRISVYSSCCLARTVPTRRIRASRPGKMLTTSEVGGQRPPHAAVMGDIPDRVHHRPAAVPARRGPAAAARSAPTRHRWHRTDSGAGGGLGSSCHAKCPRPWCACGRAVRGFVYRLPHVSWQRVAPAMGGQSRIVLLGPVPRRRALSAWCNHRPIAATGRTAGLAARPPGDVEPRPGCAAGGPLRCSPLCSPRWA
jgi:hypothetical protein